MNPNCLTIVGLIVVLESALARLFFWVFPQSWFWWLFPAIAALGLFVVAVSYVLQYMATEILPLMKYDFTDEI